MSRDYSFMKKLNGNEIARVVRSEGMLALCHNGLSEMDNATAATKAIEYLHNKNISSQTLFASNLSADDSIRKIYFKVNEDIRTSWATIDRVTEYCDFGSNSKKEDKVEHGPCVKVENAEAFVNLLNSFNWGTNNGGKHDIVE